MRGIRLEGKKEATLLVWTLKRFDPPPKVKILLTQSRAVFSMPCVQAGDRVLTGQKIAHPGNAESVYVHASLSGTVTALDILEYPEWGPRRTIEIESDKKDQRVEGFGAERKGWEQLTPEELLSLFQEFGLVDLDPKMEPLHIKAGNRTQKLILNACEPEPYLTCDHAVLMSHPPEILKGMELLRKAMGASSAVILVRDDQSEVAELFKSKIYFLKWKHVEVQMIPSIYPAGSPAMLRRLFQSQSPVESFEIFNAATAFAVYEAVVFQKPLIERGVTVAGECLIEPKNVWARLGTDFETLVKYAKGFLRPPGKIIAGGPMTGTAQKNLTLPVTAGTQALLALPAELTKPEAAEPCIRCGHCVEVCPVEISPVMITLAAEQDFFEIAADYGADACIECGNCTYVCPSKRPMLELMQYALSHVPQKNFSRP